LGVYSSTAPSPDFEASAFLQILQRAERVMSAFIGRNFFLRSILSTSDQKSFDDLEKDIKDCMQVY